MMYQPNNLSKIFFRFSREERLSPRLLDYIKMTTLNYMNRAINCCDNLFSPIFIYPLRGFLYILSLMSHKIESSRSNNKFGMMSQILVFKKIK